MSWIGKYDKNERRKVERILHTFKSVKQLQSEMQPGLRVTGHQVTGSAILAGSGRVTGQCVRRGVWPGFWVLTSAFIVAFFLQSNTISANYYLHNFTPSTL